MRPLFIASGPSFKSNYSFVDPIEMINLYSLFCHLLKIKPSSTNEGSVEQVAHILSSSKSLNSGNDDTTEKSTTFSDHSTETGKFLRQSVDSKRITHNVHVENEVVCSFGEEIYTSFFAFTCH